jgi:hypothetical protein
MGWNVVQRKGKGGEVTQFPQFCECRYVRETISAITRKWGGMWYSERIRVVRLLSFPNFASAEIFSRYQVLSLGKWGGIWYSERVRVVSLPSFHNSASADMSLRLLLLSLRMGWNVVQRKGKCGEVA